MSGPGGASVWFKWDGLDELVKQFATLAPDLTDATTPNLSAIAENARSTIYFGYPKRTGNLRKGLSVKIEHNETRAAAIIRNTAPHAHLFEKGTQARHTDIGANRGTMPANHLFTTTVERARRELLTNPVPRVIKQFGMTVVSDG